MDGVVAIGGERCEDRASVCSREGGRLNIDGGPGKYGTEAAAQPQSLLVAELNVTKSHIRLLERNTKFRLMVCTWDFAQTFP